MKFATKFQAKGSSEDFILLKDGESVEGVFAGAPYEFYQHWVNKVPHPCTGKGCEHCLQGLRATFRFRINFITKVDGQLKAKILEQSQTVYGQIHDLEESGYDTDTNKFKISRKGSGISDTVYTVLPLPNGALNADTVKIIKAIPLLDLKPKVAVKEETVATQEEAVPF